MKLIVGLGNPGKKYERTRHNIAWRVLDALMKHLHGEFSESNNIKADCYRFDDFEFIKPLTYVNESGEVVAKIRQKHHVDHDDIWIIHDDVEIPFGEVRVKLGGSSGGHNGIKSIDEVIGQDYWRIRVGVGRDPKFAELTDYVLAPFTDAEEKQLPTIIDRVVSYLIQSIDQQKLQPISFNAQEKY